MSRLGRIVREPLLHFMLLGAAMFALYSGSGGAPAGEGERVVITRGRIEQLVTGFSRMQQRLPDAAELDALIDDAIREEIYYREAKALALDQDDTIIRRRLRQKLEFVSEDVAQLPEPSEAQLLALLRAHPEKFPALQHYSFNHVYLDPARRRSRLGEDAGRLLDGLRESGAMTPPAGHGDPFLLGQRFDLIGADEVARLFGREFEIQLRKLSPGQWQGPLASGYGAHLVLLRARSDEDATGLAPVRRQVREEWLRVRRQQENERFYAGLRSRYSVEVERAVAVARIGTGTGTVAVAVAHPSGESERP
ncbi:MAG: peptidylprolyl isomerase [Pseudoxanthomonas sp.]